MSSVVDSCSHASTCERAASPTAWLAPLRRAVDTRLEAFFEAKLDESRAIGGREPALVEAIRGLTLRGGKRLRPAVAAAAYEAVSGGVPHERAAVVALGASLELLQSYLLIHDDWMDGDDERRGGVAVHTAFRRATSDDALGDALAILAGDLASSFAWELMHAAVFDASAKSARDVLAAFVRLHHEVVLGQELDLRASPDVARMMRLKTGAYTVDGPLRLGALLAGATPAQLNALEAFGAPLGEAFQVRDDLLGAFGDPTITGKPCGNDVRAGKRTALVRECERAALLDSEGKSADRALLASVLGDRGASDERVAAVLLMFERSGARERIEHRLDSLLAQSRAVLAESHALFTASGLAHLASLVDALAIRTR